MSYSNNGIVSDAIKLANELRKPENKPALDLFMGLSSRYGIGLALFDETAGRDDITDESARKLLLSIENECDTSGHSGASWSGVKAYAKVILGGNRDFMYMNWINEAEEMVPGSTEPLTEADIARNNQAIFDKRAGDNGEWIIYDDETKKYVPAVAPVQ